MTDSPLFLLGLGAAFLGGGAHNEDSDMITINDSNHIGVTADFSSATWNTMATHEVLTITGIVRLIVFIHCTESLAGALSLIAIGNATDTGALMRGSPQDVTAVDAGDFLDYASGDFAAGASADGGFGGLWNPEGAARHGNCLLDYIPLSGIDIGYELLDAPATDGTIEFHFWWWPLSVGATAVAGTGGAL